MPTTPTTPSQSDPMFAVFNGDGEITEEMYKEVQAFVDRVKQMQDDK